MSLEMTQKAGQIAEELRRYIDASVQEAGNDTTPIKPSHRTPFHWPPHPVSADYHVLASDWTARASFEAHGETFEVTIAKTPSGVFGRSEDLWNVARGDTLEEMLVALEEGARPFFERQFAIARSLGLAERFVGKIQELPETELIKLLYCEDRDVAHEAHTVIETHASAGVYSEALIDILQDTRHRSRRSAQWCVLDMFEDLPAFYPEAEGQANAVQGVKDLIWNAEDDFARTIYKAGVVLGGHVCTEPAADALIDCIAAPSKIGRRSAIHAVFHLNEWMPARKGQILTKLRNAAASDSEPQLREFAESMARDIESGAHDHMTEPLFADEP